METAAETMGLEQYGIGPKIRRLRKKKDLSLVRLGDHTGMSAGLLSKIETEQLIPTLPTLMRTLQPGELANLHSAPIPWCSLSGHPAPPGQPRLSHIALLD